MIWFKKIENFMVAEYMPELNGIEWIYEKLSKNGDVLLSKTYHIMPKDVYTDDEENNDDVFCFIVGDLENDYYILRRSIFNLNYDIYIDKDIYFDGEFNKNFVSYGKTSIMKNFSDVVKDDIYIDSKKNKNSEVYGHVTIDEFKNIVKHFPNYEETRLYVANRISQLFNEYFDNLQEDQIKYQNYVKRKDEKLKNYHTPLYYTEIKLDLLKNAYEELKFMLNNSDRYSEPDWQDKIKNIICVLFPKYMYALREVPIGEISEKSKKPDYILIDSNGFIDVMEIKKPDITSNGQIIRDSKNRNNFVPQKAFTDVIVQTAKYIATINKNQDLVKQNVSEKLNISTIKTDLLKINNPKGIILLCRSNQMSMEQLEDYELIKRQYKDIHEIMTYDELLNRLKNLINTLNQDIEQNK